MAEDVLEDFVIAAEPADFEAGLRPRAVKLRRFQKRGVLGGQQQRPGIYIGTKRSARPDIDHTRPNRGATERSRDGNATVTIHHVIVVIDFVNLDRRHIALDHRDVDVGPAISQSRADRKEAWIEIAGFRLGRGRAHDAIDRNVLHAALGAAFQAGHFQDAVDRLQVSRSAAQDGTQRSPERLCARSIEVFEGRVPLHALEDRFFGFRLEEVQAAGVEPQLDPIAWRDRHSRIDPGCNLVAADHPVEELVGAEALDNVHFHFQ